MTETEKSASYKVRNNPRIWLEYCGSILKQNGREEPPKLNWFQRYVNMIYLWCRKNKKPCRIIILKPRKKGSSTISLGICYTHLRNFIAYGAVLGDDLGTTAKLMEYWDRYARTDKFPHWPNTVSQDLRKFSHGSQVREETANDPRAGMGGDIHFLLASEAAHYRRKGKSSGEVVMTSIMNSVPASEWNTVIIMESTPNGAQGIFFETWQKGVTFEDYQAGKIGNGFIKVFAPWYSFDDSAVPDMTQEQKDHVMATLDKDPRFEGERELAEKFGVPPEKLEWRRRNILSPACNGDKRKFDQEMPKDDMTCFLQSGSGRFDPEGISAMEAVLLTNPPQWRYGVLDKPEGAEMPVFRDTAIHEAWIRINEMPSQERRYIAAADFMRGEQASASLKETDCHSGGVARAAYTDRDGASHLARVVAALMPDDRLKDIDILAERLALMAQFYGGCPLAPEINVHGDAIVSLLRKHGANVWTRKKSGNGGRTVQIPGFEMTGTSKRQVISELAALIREQEIEVPCPRMVSELRQFITWPNGEEAAGDGWHDDWVIFLAMIAHILPAASTYETHDQRSQRNMRRTMLTSNRQQNSGPIAEFT